MEVNPINPNIYLGGDLVNKNTDFILICLVWMLVKLRLFEAVREAQARCGDGVREYLLAGEPSHQASEQVESTEVASQQRFLALLEVMLIDSSSVQEFGAPVFFA